MFSYDKKDYGINLIGYSRNGDFGGRIEELKDGEKITVVYTKQVNYKKEFGQVTSETESADIKTFTYSPDMKIEVKKLNDGKYMYIGLVCDIYGKISKTDSALFEMKDEIFLILRLLKCSCSKS